jgi:predicted DNA-binding transcriptional regulator AlpA
MEHPMSADPLSAAIEAAVERAFDSRLPDIIAAIHATKPSPPVEAADRFLKLQEAARALGVHRTTIIRLEKKGELPRRRRVGSHSGYYASDLRAIKEGPTGTSGKAPVASASIVHGRRS